MTSREPASSALVRTRRREDLGPCVALLHEVHRVDGYPRTWPADPERWLVGSGGLGAWVAVTAGRVAGHVGLHSTDEPGAWPAWREAVAVGVDRQGGRTRGGRAARGRY